VCGVVRKNYRGGLRRGPILVRLRRVVVKRRSENRRGPGFLDSFHRDPKVGICEERKECKNSGKRGV